MSSNSTIYPTKPRAALGSGAAVKLRAGGSVPLTINRGGKPSQHLAIDEKSANHLAANVVHLCTVEVEGKKLTALRGAIDKDCLTDRIKHIDLQEVDAHSEIKVDVAVVPDARNCPGVKAGGIVELRSRTVKVKCKADAIPDHLTIDLGDVELQQSITVAKLTMPKGMTLVTPAKTLLLSVVIPRGLKAAAEEAAAAPAEGTEAAPAAAAAGTAAPAAGAAPAADGKAAPAAKGAAPAKEAPKKK